MNDWFAVYYWVFSSSLKWAFEDSDVFRNLMDIIHLCSSIHRLGTLFQRDPWIKARCWWIELTLVVCLLWALKLHELSTELSGWLCLLECFTPKQVLHRASPEVGCMMCLKAPDMNFRSLVGLFNFVWLWTSLHLDCFMRKATFSLSIYRLTDIYSVSIS